MSAIVPENERLAWAIFEADGKRHWSAAPPRLREFYINKAAKVTWLLGLFEKGNSDEAQRTGTGDTRAEC